MIFVLAAAVVFTVTRYTLAVRRTSPRVLWEIPAAIVAGLLAGLWLGIAARIAMRMIAVSASAPLRLSAGGTLQVIGVFAAMGAGIAILYPGIFRHALASSGLRFGLLLFLVSWYPLAQEGAQLLGYEPDPLKLMAISGVVIAGMFVPYALLLARLMECGGSAAAFERAGGALRAMRKRWQSHRTPT